MNYVPPQRGFKTFALLMSLAIGTFAITQLGQVAVNTISKADNTDEPQQIRVTNIAPTSFTVSWNTSSPTRGAIIVTDPTNIEREEYSPDIKTTHHITIDHLLPNSSYRFVVKVGNTVYYNNKGEEYSVDTAYNAPRSDSLKVFGQVIDLKDEPTPNTLVFVTLRDKDKKGTTGVATTLSSITNSQGIFTVNLEDTLDKDLSTPFYYSRNDDLIEVSARGPSGEKASVLLTTAQTQPTPAIRLTSSGRLLDLTSQTDVKGQSIILHPESKKSKENKGSFLKELFKD